MNTGDGGRRSRPRLTPLAPADDEFLYKPRIYVCARVAAYIRTTVSGAVMLSAGINFITRKITELRC
jgi:hypothetical protein